MMTKVVIISLVIMLQATIARCTDCPTWMLPQINNSKECICGSVADYIVKCNNLTKEVYVMDCYLITYDKKSHQTLVGASIYGCSQNEDNDPVYHMVSKDVYELDAMECAPLNRTGRLCGACSENHYPLVYSYKLNCILCDGSKLNWLIYTARAFIPLTLFYLFVVLFKFNAYYPSVHACILFCQLLSSPPLVRAWHRELQGSKMETPFNIITTLHGVWNLDFFLAIYPDICLRIEPLQGLSLDYAIAFYPLLLILVTYMLSDLHSKGYRLITFVWSPFQRIFLKIRKKWEIKSSMINVFTTFLFLSYNKILSVSFDLLVFVRPYTSNGHYAERFLFYDATLRYFGPQHRLYGAMAIIIYLLFAFLPFLLLFLYPMKCFQRCLNHFRLSSIILHSFADSVTGYYTDGIEPGTRDYRYFAAILLFLPKLLYLSYAITLNIYYYILGGFVVGCFCLMLTMCQPYKEIYKHYRKVTIVIFILVMLMHFMVIGVNFAQIKMYQAYDVSLYALTFILFIPTLYLTVVALKWLHKQKFCRLKCQAMKKPKKHSSNSLITAFETRSQTLRNYQSLGCIQNPNNN